MGQKEYIYIYIYIYIDMTDADYVNDLALIANTQELTKYLLRNQEQVVQDTGQSVNANKTE